jgi:bla regulator protein BlaR1
MIEAGQALPILDDLGRGVIRTLLVPSLEVFVLGAVVWVLLRAYGERSPRIRHLFWVLVILKPMISLILPWQGPFALPFAPLPGDMPSSAPPAALSGTAGWMAPAYALVAVLWGLAAVLVFLWTVADSVRLYARSRQTMPIPVPWVQALFVRCQRTVGIKRPVLLRMSDEFASPALVALGRPMVVIPSWCLIQLSPQELKQVFLHELLHYARRDHLTLCLVQVARILFFFHPLIWYAGRRIGIEAERACDVAVVRVARRPESYAASLLKVAEGTLRTRWHGILELARSTSATALRIHEVLKGFDARMHIAAPRIMLPLAVCGLLSVVPLFHLPVSLPVSERISAPLLAERARSAYGPGNAFRPLAATAAAGDDTGEAVPAAPGAPVPEKTAALSDASGRSVPVGVPYVHPAMPYRLIKGGPAFPRRAEETAPMRSDIDPAALGLAEPLPSQTEDVHSVTRWEPGQIEVEGAGQNSSQIGSPGRVSVRAGYFVTRTHELGGVFSVIGAGERWTGQNDAHGLALKPDQPAVRIKPSSIRTKPSSFSDDPFVPSRDLAQDDRENQPIDEIIQIGGFYRYNVTRLNETVVPFLSLGAGVEIRPGRNPVLIDSGAGVRCFFARRGALILQVDYRKEVEFTTRSHINASLGFSTIF